MFENIDSTMPIPNGTEELILANVGILAPKLRDVPLFLVNRIQWIRSIHLKKEEYWRKSVQTGFCQSLKAE
jgi:hypothetical protein